jgi:hypothetical protein
MKANALLSTFTPPVRERANGIPIPCGEPLGCPGIHAIQRTWRAPPGRVQACEDQHAREGFKKATVVSTRPTIKTQMPLHPLGSSGAADLAGRAGLAGSAEGPPAMFGGWGFESSGDRRSPTRPRPEPVCVPGEGQDDGFRFQDDAGDSLIPLRAANPHRIHKAPCAQARSLHPLNPTKALGDALLCCRLR